MKPRKPSKSTAVAIKPDGAVRHYASTGNRVTFVPLSIKRRQHRTMLIAPQADGESSSMGTTSFDLPLIRTLGKAYYWQKLLDSGEVPTIAALADRLGLHQGWVAEVLRMARLAPDIVQAILSGKQPRHLNLHALRGRQAVVKSSRFSATLPIGNKWIGKCPCSLLNADDDA